MRKNVFNLTNRIVPVLKRPVADFYVTQGYSTTRNLDDPALFSSLHPWFVTGFVDAEGCFRLSILKNKELKTGFKVELIFQIGLHENDKAILELIQSSLGVGKIYKHGNESFQFRVSSIKDLEVIINHFDKYPLQTQKQADYLLFKRTKDIIKNKEHLTIEGLDKIVAIKASMNLGLSDKLKAEFSGIKPVARPLVENRLIPDPNWLAGFISGEGCFFIGIMKSSSHLLGERVKLRFTITQHSRDQQLVQSFISYLGYGNVYNTLGNAIDFYVSKISDITERLIPLFMFISPILLGCTWYSIDRSKIVIVRFWFNQVYQSLWNNFSFHNDTLGIYIFK